MLSGGYMGRLLSVDLSEQRVEELPLPSEEILRAYYGGAGLGVRLLYDDPGPHVDPLGPENVLLFLTGPLTGTRVPLSGRHAVCARSPLTGVWGESDIGGTFGTALKRAGYDGVIVRGAAEKPVYLWITEDGAEIRDAGHLWGRDYYETDELLRAETHPKAVTHGIGQAGERLCRIAAVMSDGRDGRAAGRTGLGAVMGSKRLKALVAYGTRQIPVADPEALAASIKARGTGIRGKMENYTLFGSAGGVEANARLADMPAHNWTVGDWTAHAPKISGQRMAETILIGRYYCGACIVGCGRRVRVVDSPWGNVDGGGPEYEAMAGLGSMVGVDDLYAVARANELCNRYGIDVISCGGVMGFAIEAFEKGLLTAADTGGLELRWSDPNVLLTLVELIGRREGIGALLGEGVKRAAERIGGVAAEFALEVKGLELPYHDPRALSSLAVSYATMPRGACHRGNTHGLERYGVPELGYPEPLPRHATTGKGVAVARMQDYQGLFNALKLCQFMTPAIAISDIVRWLNAVTGWDVTLPELLTAGERMNNLKRMYNVRLGLSRKDDALPARVLMEAFTEGGSAGYLPDFVAMLNEYYDYRGWTRDGIPTGGRLRALGLDREIADLPPAYREREPLPRAVPWESGAAAAS